MKIFRIWLCLLLTFALASCADTGGGQNAAKPDISAEAKQSEDAETSENEERPEEAEASGTAGQTEEAEASGDEEESPKTAEARDLTADELRQWSDFLSQIDCYGFLMSAYETPLDANLEQVFYNGGGVGEYPTEEMMEHFLTENGFEEAYTDVIFIPYDAANQVLQRRTGYTLEHFRLAGNDIPMFYSQKYAGYFHMAGDTNAIRVECASGLENPDGSIFLKSREKSWTDEPDDGFSSSFETTLRPDAQGRGMVFDRNAITGGWLSWANEPDAE